MYVCKHLKKCLLHVCLSEFWQEYACLSTLQQEFAACKPVNPLSGVGRMYVCKLVYMRGSPLAGVSYVHVCGLLAGVAACMSVNLLAEGCFMHVNKTFKQLFAT